MVREREREKEKREEGKMYNRQIPLKITVKQLILRIKL